MALLNRSSHNVINESVAYYSKPNEIGWVAHIDYTLHFINPILCLMARFKITRCFARID